jgi:hypothetical protein
VFVVDIVEMRSPLSHGLRCAKWHTRLWRQWKGCSMNVFPQQVVEDHIVVMRKIIGRNLEAKIQALAMDFTSVMVVEDAVVDAVLILIISMVAVVLMAAVCILKMKNLMTLVVMWDLMIMRIPLQMMDYLVGVENIVDMLIMKIESIIVVVVIEMTLIAVLVSS